MIAKKKDFGVDGLLAQNGERYFIDDQGNLEVIFKVTCVSVTSERPHGLNYSLVLLNAKGERIVCFDNAHAVSQGSGPGKKHPKQHDHKHIGSKVIPYKYKDAHTLVADFWKEVDRLV
jgi:Family of unknown function (DUF6516)